MLDEHNIHLQWVLVDGEIHHVSDFAHLPKGKRPPAVCPVCSQPVTLKLGNVRVHHCAHAPNVNCPATHPETIVHLNTKLHLYRQLQQASTLNIVARCTQGRIIKYSSVLPKEYYAFAPEFCRHTQIVVWQQNWDSVEVEYTVGSRRPDIALLCGGQVIGAIEIFVSHAVDEEKAHYLKKMDIPWLEVIGKEGFYSGETAWTSDKPLPVFRMQPDEWMCDGCRKFQEKARKYEEYYLKTSAKTHAVKIVDFYYPSGKHYRAVYVVTEQITNGERSKMILHKHDGEPIATVTAPITPDSIKQLTQKFKAMLKQWEQAGAIIDSPMQWNQDNLLNNYNNAYVVFSNRHYPNRYIWSAQQKKWIRSESYEKISWDKPNQ